LLFEPATISTAYDIESVINETITNFEPRVRIVSVSADPAIDRNSYEISIKFRVINRSTVRSLEFTLERLR
jgi:predicted component of type VI protein secretion system